jgi:hypothetical protein
MRAVPSPADEHNAGLLGGFADAARLNGATRSFAQRAGWPLFGVRRQAHEHTARVFAAAKINVNDIDRWAREGSAMDEAAIAAVCMSVCATDSAPET